jgi:hypothetical protein
MTALAIDSTQSATKSRQEAGLLLRSIRGAADSPLIPLGVGRHVIGSAPDADVRLDVHGVEAQHAVLLIGPHRTVLKGFSRFTWVNDGVVRECAVKPGDRVCFGPVEFEIVKPKSRRRRLPASPPAIHHAEPPQATAAPAYPGWATTQVMPLITELRASAPIASGPSRREKLIGELNNELLQHLAQLVERETVAADRERRIVEQTAQLEGRRRIAEDRLREFERVQVDLARAEADWQKKSAELAEQSARLQAERESIEHDRQKLAEDLARLTAQTLTHEQRRATLDVREARLEEQQAALELRVTQLNHQEQRHSEVVAQALVTSKTYSDDVHRLAEQKSAVQRAEEQLQQERDQLQREREQYDSERNSLISERVHLATREVEIAELRRRVQEQRAEFEAREDQAQGLFGEAGDHQTAGETLSELAEREHRIAESEAALAMQRNELDERKREIDEQHAAWMLERHTEAARSAPEQRESDHETQAEIGMLRTQISELQSRLREERGFWEMERSALAARAEAAESAPQSDTEAEASYASPASIAELQAQLEVERVRYQQDRDAWEAEQDLLLRDRQALEAEWRRLEARAEQACNTFEQSAVEESTELQEVAASVVPPPIPGHLLSDFLRPAEPEANEQSWADGDSLQQHAEGDEHAQYDAESQQVTDWNSPEQDQFGFDANQEYSEQPEYAEETSFEEAADPSEPARPAPAVGGDVSSLRAQLAELFGLQPTPDDEQAQDFADAGQEADNGFESSGLEANSFSEADPSAEAEAFDGEQPTSEYDEAAEETASDEEEGGKSDEDIMSAYLARLLKKSPEDQEPALKPVKAPEPMPEAPSQPPQPVSEQEGRATRRLNAEEKETLRANMDSFREIANQQARAAVAKHKSNELKSGMQTTSVVAVLLALVGFILLSAEFWSGQSYLIYGVLCLVVSGGLGVYTLVNGIKIRRLKAIEKAAEVLTEGPGSVGEKAAEEPAAAE